eukprot:TRINITY_DN2529_c1_g1_i1.p1 TRINITY_DN2529_c1_g1~~TRINITY_DN2529_c1_g1_i1.p1  ORF type:complete len:132 (+),score=3.91 TRINITY_DN2529_c1_g1_i1:289-684(+)
MVPQERWSEIKRDVVNILFLLLKSEEAPLVLNDIALYACDSVSWIIGAKPLFQYACDSVSWIIGAKPLFQSFNSLFLSLSLSLSYFLHIFLHLSNVLSLISYKFFDIYLMFSLKFLTWFSIFTTNHTKCRN